jgi:hypothetical protein
VNPIGRSAFPLCQVTFGFSDDLCDPEEAMPLLRTFFACVIATATSLGRAAPAAEAQLEVDLQLILAADVSGSLSPEELAFQRSGHVEAFRDPSLMRAIRSGLLGRIAVLYFEWAGNGRQIVVLPWMILGDEASVETFARRLEQAPSSAGGSGTSISSAVLFAARQFDASGVSSRRRTIDMSIEGANNQGPPVAWARDRVARRGITINALAVPRRDAGPFAGLFGADESELKPYLEERVIGGSGAFASEAEKPDDYGSAILRKLVMEIASADPGPRRRRADGKQGPDQRRLAVDSGLLEHAAHVGTGGRGADAEPFCRLPEIKAARDLGRYPQLGGRQAVEILRRREPLIDRFVVVEEHHQHRIVGRHPADLLLASVRSLEEHRDRDVLGPVELLHSVRPHLGDFLRRARHGCPKPAMAFPIARAKPATTDLQ